MAIANLAAKCKYCGHPLLASTLGASFLGGTGAFKKSAVLKLCRNCDCVTPEDFEHEPMTQATESRRCVYCERGWPVDGPYGSCPVCREPTMPSEASPTMTADQARVEARYAGFGWFLWDSGQM